MPLATFPGRRGWGYDGVDLFAPFPPTARRRNLLGSSAPAIRSGSPCCLMWSTTTWGRTEIIWAVRPLLHRSLQDRMGAAINYDGPQSDEVRRFVIDNALMWLTDYEFDGLRLDAVHAIFSFDAVHVLEELSTAVKALGKQLGPRWCSSPKAI